MSPLARNTLARWHAIRCQGRFPPRLCNPLWEASLLANRARHRIRENGSDASAPPTACPQFTGKGSAYPLDNPHPTRIKSYLPGRPDGSGWGRLNSWLGAHFFEKTMENAYLLTICDAVSRFVPRRRAQSNTDFSTRASQNKVCFLWIDPDLIPRLAEGNPQRACRGSEGGEYRISNWGSTTCSENLA